MAGKHRRQRLGDYFTLQRGVTYKSRLLGLPGPVLLGLATIQRNGGFRTDSLKTYGGECPAKLLVQPGELYVSLKDVTQSADLLGAVARLPRDHAPGRLTQDTVKLEPKAPDVPLDYLYWLLRTPQYRSYCRSHATGTTNLGLAREDFLAFPAPEPTQDQQKTVNTLSALDDKIELNRRMNETLEAIARAIFKSWFVDFDPVSAKASGEPPESICRRLGLTPDLLALFPDRLVDSELGQIPEGWEQKRVDDLMELAYGKALKASDRVDGPVPVYGSGGITGYHSEHLVDGPGIIVGRKGTVGSLYWEDCAFFPIDTVFYVVPKVELTFCYYLLQTLGLDRMNTDAAVPGLNRNNVYRLPIAWAPTELRNAFDRVAKPLRDRLFANKQESQTLENIRDALLPKLLAGELRVQDDKTSDAMKGVAYG